MGLNNDGYSGVDIEQIALEKIIIVGTQAPNISPTIKIDETGKSLPKMEIASNGGTQVLSTGGWDCSYVDTSWLSHGGIYSVVAGNKVNLTAGAGGFEWKTAGPSKFNIAFQEFLCTHCFDVNTRLFSVSSTERTHLMGGRFDADYEEVYIQGNTNFVNNVHINGGLYVNGEFYCAHMTSQKQINFTQTGPAIKGFLNPGQSFLVFNGLSLASEKIVQPSVGWSPGNIPDRIGMIDCFVAINLPDPIGMVEAPCKIAFPNGLSLLSDAMYGMHPESETIVANGSERPQGCGLNMPDIIAPGHVHAYKGPAVNYVNDTSSIYQQAAKMMESNSPHKSKPCLPDGMASLDQFPQMLQEAAVNSLKEYLKNIWEDVNPFRTKTSI